MVLGGPAYGSEQELSFLHLQAEISRLDVMIRRQVALWQAAGQEWGDSFRGLYVSDHETAALLDRPFSSHWGAQVQLSAPEEARFEGELQVARQRVAQIVQQAAEEGKTLRLEMLRSIFGLQPFELDAFLICAAASLDLRYERLYAYLQDDVTRKRPTVNLILDLLEPPDPKRLMRLSSFREQAPLFRNRLLEYVNDAGGGQPILLNQVLAADDTIVSWLVGQYHFPPELALHSRLRWFVPHLPSSSDRSTPELSSTGRSETCPNSELSTTPAEALFCNAEVRAQLDYLARMPASPPVLVLHGVDQSGQDIAARYLASRLERFLFEVDLTALASGSSRAYSRIAPEDGSGALSAAVDRRLLLVQLALRDAHLLGALPYFKGWDLRDVEHRGGDEGDALFAALLSEVFAYPDFILLSGKSLWQVQGIERERRLLWLELGIPPFSERYELWRYYIQADMKPGQAGKSPIPELHMLAGQFRLTSGQIRDAVLTARDWAAQRGSAMQLDDLFAAARSHSNPNLVNLARKITPRYDWDDIIVPEDQRALLRELIDTVRGRPLVLEAWGLGRKLTSSQGVTVLFAGPPGTGKTMAAEIIARELGLDLYKIDLSTVVSKYIGETEKNLERIFNEASSSNAILFFDEADAIFGKRSEVKDAHDRYANIEISYLLQRMEAYDGVTILATNLRANLDDAFTRRLQFAVDFPFPDEEQRLQIWKTLFPPDVPCASDLDFEILARRFRLAGGNIRNIIVSASYLAAADSGQVTMDHLLHGTRRELQKMGRLIGEDDLRLN